MRSAIERIERERRASIPWQRYDRSRFTVLPANTTPEGFDMCLRTRDSWVAQERVDRAHLHCWRRDREGGGIYQMLLSCMEYGHPSGRVSATVDRDAERVLTSVRVAETGTG